MTNPSFSALVAGAEEQSHDDAGNHCRCNAAGCRAQAAGEDTQPPISSHGLFHASGQQVTKTGKGDRCAGTAPLHQRFL